ncbi:MAG: pentapeptide repeat-containing protein [Merismopedia sp. SIO2A8]|nr:pentapeptide repeat-containing protein [Symploca sp. SIO2B6]NET48327.1 pentapeptide repeat-containing protein [Merismopedia sp. SIO2A8]
MTPANNSQNFPDPALSQQQGTHPKVPHQDFSHQNWRDRSFHNQDLRYANFEGADVRGCDFRGAQLEGTTFKNAKVGRSQVQTLVVLITTTILLILGGHAFSEMIFGGLGTTQDDPSFPYVMALNTALALAGSMTGLQQWVHQPPLLRQGIRIIAIMAVCALLGFFYGGSLTNNNPQGAIAAASTLGLVGIMIGAGWGPRWPMAGLTVLGAIAAYGFCFTTSTYASTLLHAHHYSSGIGWGTISFLYLTWTLNALSLSSQRLTAAMNTCFDPFP